MSEDLFCRTAVAVTLILVWITNRRISRIRETLRRREGA